MAIVVIGILLTAVASSSKEQPKEHRQVEESIKESEIKRRQYQHSSRRPSIISRRPSYPIRDSSSIFGDDGFVQYDPSGFGFDIPKPRNLFKAFEQSDPFKASAYGHQSDHSHFDSELPWIVDPDLKPIYPRELLQYPELPELIFRGNNPKQKPSYKHENTYPIKEAHHPEIPNKYEEKNPYNCPKIAGYESHCQPAKDCAIWYDLVLTTPGTACKLVSNGHPGMCCPLLPYNSKKNLN